MKISIYYLYTLKRETLINNNMLLSNRMKGSIVIRISQENAKRLERFGKFGDKWDDLLTKLFKKAEEKDED